MQRQLEIESPRQEVCRDMPPLWAADEGMAVGCWNYAQDILANLLSVFIECQKFIQKWRTGGSALPLGSGCGAMGCEGVLSVQNQPMFAR